MVALTDWRVRCLHDVCMKYDVRVHEVFRLSERQTDRRTGEHPSLIILYHGDGISTQRGLV